MTRDEIVHRGRVNGPDPVSSRVGQEQFVSGVRVWEIPTMKTVTVDSKKRIRIPDSRPGQVYAYIKIGQDTFQLIRVEPVRDKPTPVRFEKRGKYTVGVSDVPVSMEAIQEALDEFP